MYFGPLGDYSWCEAVQNFQILFEFSSILCQIVDEVFMHPRPEQSIDGQLTYSGKGK